MERLKTPLEVFLAVCDRNARIDMEPVGFTRDMTTGGRFYLRPVRKGKAIGHEPTIEGYPYIDFDRAGLRSQVDVSGSGKDPLTQLNEQVWKLMQSTILAGRRFYMRLSRDPAYFPPSYSIELTKRQSFPVEFSTWRAIPKWLMLNRQDQEPPSYLHWSAFAPEGTVEHDAVADMLEFVETKAMQRPPGESEMSALEQKARTSLRFARV